MDIVSGPDEKVVVDPRLPTSLTQTLTQNCLKWHDSQSMLGSKLPHNKGEKIK